MAALSKRRTQMLLLPVLNMPAIPPISNGSETNVPAYLYHTRNIQWLLYDRHMESWYNRAGNGSIAPSPGGKIR